MRLRIALDEKVMDVRLRDRLVAEGKLSKKDLDQYLGTLTEESSDNFERLTEATDDIKSQEATEQ